jgi:hypothetical protein
VTVSDHDRRVRRLRLLAGAIALPAVLAAVALVALEGWRLESPESSLFKAPQTSFADALGRGDVSQAYERLRAGQSPDDLIAVRHPVLTGGRGVLVSPLVWAVANGQRESALMLIAFAVSFVGMRTKDARAADAAAAT